MADTVLVERLGTIARLTINRGDELRPAKEALRASERLPIEDGLVYERDLFSLCFSSEDKREGVPAFLAKQTPSWRGR